MTCVSAASFQRLRDILYPPIIAPSDMRFSSVKCWDERVRESTRSERAHLAQQLQESNSGQSFYALLFIQAEVVEPEVIS
jgi:hypothetical protein